MINAKALLQKIESGDVSYEDKLLALGQVETALKEMRDRKEAVLNDRVGVIVDALKTMQAKVAAQLEEAKAIVPAKGDKGADGRDGPPGKDGANGRDGRDGVDGEDGRDGADGVSVTDANIDFDGSLIITLSSGRTINVGEVVAPDLAEKIKVITNGGGTSQSVLDTLTSLQNQIDALSGGAVDSVNGQTGVVVLDAADVGAEPADATILKDADIGVTVQGYSAVLAGTTASFTTADETKLDGIAAGAEVNVNADWNAVSGDAQILNKPTLGTAAAADTTDFATTAQGALADSALQAADIGVTVQGYSSVLAGTTASFTTADETKLDGIQAGAEVNVNADWNAGSGDAQILNKPAILAFSGGITTIAIVSSLPGSPDANTLYVVV